MRKVSDSHLESPPAPTWALSAPLLHLLVCARFDGNPRNLGCCEKSSSARNRSGPTADSNAARGDIGAASRREVASDRRASLDEETEIKPTMRKLVEDEFRRGATVPVAVFPEDGVEIPDTPRLSLVLVDPEVEWSAAGLLRAQLSEWTANRGKSPRLYPAALVWCLKKPGRDLRER